MFRLLMDFWISETLKENCTLHLSCIAMMSNSFPQSPKAKEFDFLWLYDMIQIYAKIQNMFNFFTTSIHFGYLLHLQKLEIWIYHSHLSPISLAKYEHELSLTLLRMWITKYSNLNTIPTWIWVCIVKLNLQ